MNINTILKVLGTLCIIGAVTIYAKSSIEKQVPTETPEKSTVMITNLRKNSGGSGVTIESSDKQSKVLTNSHVCEVAINGGKVIDSNGTEFLVKEMYRSNVHDICMLTVAGRLTQAAQVSPRPPKKFEQSKTIGHPNLLPDIISVGHFSDVVTIQVVTGFKECKEEEIKTEQDALMCAFFGQLPVVRTYDSQVTSNLIMPGSSGSAVYNSNNQLSGLVFAGSEGLSYAFTVPYEHIVNFLTIELSSLKKIVPNYTNEVAKKEPTTREKFNDFRSKCEKTDSTTIKNICQEIINNTTVF